MTEFWGIDFQGHSKKETFKIIDNCLIENDSEKPLIIATLNSELLLLSEKNKKYRDVLNNTGLKNVDGFGVKLMGWLKNKRISERIAGADLAGYVLRCSIKNKLKIAFVFRKDGLSNLDDMQQFSSNFQSNIKCIEYDLNERDSDKKINLQLQDREIVLVGVGAPHQESFIYENKNYWPSLRLAIGIGGTFDFWTGKQRRAPKFMRKMGLEWLWRFFIKPNRAWKIWRSTIVFMFKSLIK